MFVEGFKIVIFRFNHVKYIFNKIEMVVKFKCYSLFSITYCHTPEYKIEVEAQREGWREGGRDI